MVNVQDTDNFKQWIRTKCHWGHRQQLAICTSVLCFSGTWAFLWRRPWISQASRGGVCLLHSSVVWHLELDWELDLNWAGCMWKQLNKMNFFIIKVQKPNRKLTTKFLNCENVFAAYVWSIDKMLHTWNGIPKSTTRNWWYEIFNLFKMHYMDELDHYY